VGGTGIPAWRDKKILWKKISPSFQLNIEYIDGTTETITSDESWKVSTGGIQYAEIYHGETYNASLEKRGCSSPGTMIQVGQE